MMTIENTYSELQLLLELLVKHYLNKNRNHEQKGQKKLIKKQEKSFTTKDVGGQTSCKGCLNNNIRQYFGFNV